MAEEKRNFCVKCDEKISEASEKILKCNGNCNKGLHYTCSSYNTTELEFLESNKHNIKWFCDGCSQNTSVFCRSISSRIPETVLIEKDLEAPVIVEGKNNVDIIGPPDPISNLRPIIRRPSFNETVLQRRLREMQDETQKWNQSFWEKHNTKFIKERQEYIKLFLIRNAEQQPTADDMSEFYKKFLDANWESHVKYNLEWYKRNFTLLFLALGVSVDNILHRI